MFFMRYQVAIAVCMTSLKYEDILEMNGKDFTAITNVVASFLMSQG